MKEYQKKQGLVKGSIEVLDTLDRLVHNAYKYNLAGDSMRKTLALRQFEDENRGH